MKTKTFTLSTLILAAATLLFYNGCKRVDCATLYTGANPNISFEFRNSQGLDLLNPATPNHYDTALIKRLNVGKAFVSSPASSGRIALSVQWTTDPTEKIISLSNTDQDTIFTSGEVTGNSCNLIRKLTTVKYNGSPVTTDASFINPFIIVKQP